VNEDQLENLCLDWFRAELRDTLLSKFLSGEVDLSFSNEEPREATR